MKKKSALNKAKNEVRVLIESLRICRHEKEQLSDICSKIKMILQPRDISYSSSYNDIKFIDLPVKIMELFLRTKMNEGFEPVVVDHKRDLLEIIRWLVKPSTAEKRTMEEIREKMLR